MHTYNTYEYLYIQTSTSRDGLDNSVLILSSFFFFLIQFVLSAWIQQPGHLGAKEKKNVCRFEYVQA